MSAALRGINGLDAGRNRTEKSLPDPKQPLKSHTALVLAVPRIRKRHGLRADASSSKRVGNGPVTVRGVLLGRQSGLEQQRPGRLQSPAQSNRRTAPACPLVCALGWSWRNSQGPGHPVEGSGPRGGCASPVSKESHLRIPGRRGSSQDVWGAWLL